MAHHVRVQRAPIRPQGTYSEQHPQTVGEPQPIATHTHTHTHTHPPTHQAIWLFDSTPVLPGGYSTNELSEDAPVRKVASFPQELVFVGRSTVLIRGIAAALGVQWSLANEWAPFSSRVLEPRRGVAKAATETVVRFKQVLPLSCQGLPLSRSNVPPPPL